MDENPWFVTGGGFMKIRTFRVSLFFVLTVFFFFSLPPSANAASKTKTKTPQPELDREAALRYSYDFDDVKDYEARKIVRTPSEIWQRITTGGWPDMMTNFETRFRPGRSYVVLFEKMPIWPIDMRSPDRLKRSMLGKEIAGKTSIGHMSVGWSCAASSTSDRRSEGFVAQTGEEGQQKDMVDNGWGITSMLSTFTDGHLQNGEEVQNYFATQYYNSIDPQNETARFFALVVEVPGGECDKVRSFVRDYVFHPLKPYKKFGLVPDPLKFEGAGCGSFAASALSRAPSLNPIVQTFWRTLPVAEKLLGKRTEDLLPENVIPFAFAKTPAEERVVSKYKLSTINWDSGKIAANIRIVDPELSIFSFRELAAISEAGSETPPTPYQKKNLEPLRRFFNFASPRGEQAPNSPDLGYQEVVSTFDASFNRVEVAVYDWWQRRAQESQIHIISFPLGAGVMIETRR